MDFEVVTITDDRLLPVRLAQQILDQASVLAAVLKCKGSRCDKTQRNTSSRSEGLADGPDFTLPPNVSLLNRLLSNAREAWSARHSDVGLVDQAVPPELGFLNPLKEEALPVRLVHAVQSAVVHGLGHVPKHIAASSSRTYLAAGEGDFADLAFLKAQAALSFPRRLGNEILAFVSALTHDPRGCFTSVGTVTEAAKARQKKIRAGVLAAGAAYLLLLASAYVSHGSSSHLLTAPKQQTLDNLVLIAPPPAIAKPAAPKMMEPPAARPHELSQPKPASSAEPVQASAPRPSSVTVTNAQPKTESTTGNAPANASASTLSGTGNGEGVATGGTQGLPGGSAAGTGTAARYDGVFSVASVSSRPRILSRPLPGYTDDARRCQIEGTVKVSVVLRSDGTVGNAEIVKGLGHGLDEKALEAAGQLQFVPAEKDGHKVSVRVFLDFKFSLL